VIEPLVAVTVIVYVPAAPLPFPVNVSIDVPLPPDVTVTETGLKVALTPEGGLAVSETVPLKPFKLAIVMVAEAEPDFDMLRLDGAALMLKSGGGGGKTLSE